MESYGQILKEAREQKELDLDRVSKEISIDKKYLQGLEDEDNGVFPGEAYLTGFLRNYAIYLDLNAEFLLKLYHNKEIQESPLPEGLLVQHKSKAHILPVLIPLLVIAVGLGVILFMVIRKNHLAPQDNVVISSNIKNKQYELSDKKFNQRVYMGDQFIIPAENDGKIILTVRDTLSSFCLDTPSGKYYIDLAEESELDVNGDNISDMIVYVSDISSSDAARGAEVSVLLRHGIASKVENVDMDDIPFVSDLKTNHPQKVLIEDNRAYPFTINASFRGNCLFRDKVDRESAVEAYFSRGEIFTANPHNGIRLWISNGNTVNLSVVAASKNIDLGLGSPGQVQVQDIKWIKDTDGKYKLVVIELD